MYSRRVRRRKGRQWWLQRREIGRGRIKKIRFNTTESKNMKKNVQRNWWTLKNNMQREEKTSFQMIDFNIWERLREGKGKASISSRSTLLIYKARDMEIINIEIPSGTSKLVMWQKECWAYGSEIWFSFFLYFHACSVTLGKLPNLSEPQPLHV